MGNATMASFVKTITVLLVTLLLLSKSHSKRQKRFIFGQNGCQTLIQCLAAGNSLFPYRLNFNPITAYDRIESHLQGRNGWSRSETRNFQRQRNRIDRQRQRQEQRRKLHRQRLQLLRKRHQQVQDKIGIRKLYTSYYLNTKFCLKCGRESWFWWSLDPPTSGYALVLHEAAQNASQDTSCRTNNFCTGHRKFGPDACCCKRQAGASQGFCIHHELCVRPNRCMHDDLTKDLET